MTVARSVRVWGRVQGVFFRAWTREQARDLGLAGWVRNCSDGTVEAHVEGELHPVDRLIARLREGPAQARVDRLESCEVEPENFEDFAIRR